MILPTRKIAIAIAGFGVLLAGVFLLVVPVPGTSFVVIPLGFSILAKEFTWASRALGWTRRTTRALWSAISPRRPYASRAEPCSS